MLLDKFVEQGFLLKDFTFPCRPRSVEEYKVFKERKLPACYLNQLGPELLSADEMFKQNLSETCTPKIAKRLEEHVYNFKHPKHHRNPISIFLQQISKCHPSWHREPRLIENELLRFRNAQLSDYGRNTAYARYQNVKKAFIVLRNHGLILKETDLPDNLRRDTNTQKIRKDNPLLCSTFIYDERQVDTFRNTENFIESLVIELRRNMDKLLQEARKVVWRAYQKFAEKDALITKSQRSVFLESKDFKIPSSSRRNTYFRQNPFAPENSNRLENLVAYFDHFFDQFTGQQPRPKLNGLRVTNEVKAHLSLTVQVASAMQIVIIEELGINPYSLYKVKVFTDGRGQEFVQLTGNGSVRLKASKPRARRTRTVVPTGTLEDLSSIEEHKINAAVCLKMALKMTERVRASTNQNALWLCQTKSALEMPTPESFQNAFNEMRRTVALEQPGLKFATLKKVRTTKAVWIYLTSNGDSLKTASYLGNSVKTTLHRYIPPYLTELVYRVKIRSFQNILLYMSLAHENEPEKCSGKTLENYDQDLKRAFSNPYMGGRLYKALASSEDIEKDEPIIYFCVSIKNIMLALQYAKNGKDEVLKRHCRIAIERIAEGPIIMKQLLRHAEKQLTQQDDPGEM
jgi:hypothetical protein